jgi:hypothetical protein
MCFLLLSENSVYSFKKFQAVGLTNGEAVYFMQGKICTFKYYLD